MNTRPTILQAARIKRETFDPTNEAHRASFQKFLTSGNWGSVCFQVEQPYTTVPETVMRKFCLHMLSNEVAA